jgi:small subunit ribosomal protein S5
MNKKETLLKYQEKILQIKRVTKVVKGGKKMTFRVIVIIGNSFNKVGIGIGRGDDITVAIEKALISGKKNLITVDINEICTIPYMINQAYGACKIMLKPATLGTGLKAGSSVRTVLELVGIKNILTKQHGSSNLLNNARATILALKTLYNI